MKEIKFRQFVNGKWHYWGFIEDNKTFIGPASLTEDNYQYTGLKDNKRTKKYPQGQEIYEGDILKYSVDGYEQKTTYVVKDTVEWFQDMNAHDPYYQWDDEGEIIGNKSETTELLKEETDNGD